MLTALLSFATSRLGIAVIAGLVVAVGLVWLYLDAKAAGAASVAAAAAAEAIRRAQAAQRARANVDPSREAIENDADNLDRRR